MKSSEETWYDRMLARAEHDVMMYNKTKGILGQDRTNADGTFVKGDGIDCPLCLNRGMTWFVDTSESEPHVMARPCKCLDRRSSIRRMREAGLGDVLDKYTFDNFIVTEPWQQAMLDKAKEYVEIGANERKWLFFGGQPGSGKTMLCVAATAELVRRGMAARYVLWPQVSKRLKAIAMDAVRYQDEIEPLQTVKLLFIDDFAKPISSNVENAMTQADVKLAFEILNQRMIDQLPTIISSELYVREMGNIDEAMASRIYEMSTGYKVEVKRDGKRNYRWKDDDMV